MQSGTPTWARLTRNSTSVSTASRIEQSLFGDKLWTTGPQDRCPTAIPIGYSEGYRGYWIGHKFSNSEVA